MFLSVALIGVAISAVLFLVYGSNLRTKIDSISHEIDKKSDLITFAYTFSSEDRRTSTLETLLAETANDQGLTYIELNENTTKVAYFGTECRNPTNVPVALPTFENLDPKIQTIIRFCVDEKLLGGLRPHELLFLFLGLAPILAFFISTAVGRSRRYKELATIANENLHMARDIVNLALKTRQSSNDPNYGHWSDMNSILLEMKEGARKHNIQDIDIGKLTEAVILESKVCFSDGVRFHHEPISAMSKVDPLKFKTIIRVIINNAVKAFGSRHGEIIISIATDSTNIRVRTSNDGPSMTPNELKSLFQARKDGHGYGLSSAKKFIEYWGGKLSYVPTEKGCTFEIMLKQVVPIYKVLIDDTPSEHLAWKAKGHALRVVTKLYYSIDEFIDDYRSVPFSTPIILDSRLGSGVRGEIDGKRIHDLGYKVYLASCGDVELPSWALKGSKDLER